MIKTQDEIQRAHDLLWEYVHGTLPIGMDKKSQENALVALSVLCWFLNHEGGKPFYDVLSRLNDWLSLLGYDQVLIPESERKHK